MNNKLYYLLLILAINLLSNSISAQDRIIFKGKVLEHLSFKSNILNETVNYSIYLPYDYDTSTLSYPSVYLLHGYSDDETAWTQFGEVHLTVDRAIESREIPPMIIIMPDAKITWGINDYKNEFNYEDMFMEELIPYMEAEYRIKSNREFRGVSGLSMGGYTSLVYTLRHPDKFVACAALSAGVFTDEEIVTMPDNLFTLRYKAIFDISNVGKERLTDYWYQNSVLELVKKVPSQTDYKSKFYIDCGDDDFLYKGNSALHNLMFELKIPHEYRVRDGAHNWSYWRSGIGEGLKFIGNSFRR